MGGDAEWSRLLAEQVRGNSRLLYRLAFGVLRDGAAAEDVCQQALLKAWERRGTLRDGAALRAWLARVVVTESLYARRRRGTERRLLARQWQPAETNGSGASPSGEMRESVLAAMEKLPEQARLVVALRLMQGLTGEEARALLGCSAGEVSKQLHRGMDMLRELLADWKPV